ncbi:MAG: RecX family transcriptional regulator [Bacteroidales bacterium]|jgi:regulatory protein|nr:RecX family transcriptional regulator [Bacteroidales bacterium]
MKSTKSESNDIEKIKRYCAYQERCLYDVRCKLKEWKINQEITESIIDELIDENYIDEERFAKVFARGKFNIKSWGRLKIIAELEKRNINSDHIRKAMQEIKQSSYLERLDRLTNKWLEQNPNGNRKKKVQRLLYFLTSKGYESNEIWNCINSKYKKI